MTTSAPASSLWKRKASPTLRPDSFMKVCGASSMTRFEAIAPSEARPEKRARNGPMRCAAAIASSAMKPILWRLRRWRWPGLPSPAMTSMRGPRSIAPRAAPAAKPLPEGRERFSALLLGGLGRGGLRGGGRSGGGPLGGCCCALGGSGGALRRRDGLDVGSRRGGGGGRASRGRLFDHDGRRNDGHDREIARRADRPAAFRQLEGRNV